ncbi:hypothetical protein RUR49_11175 [Pseudoxanthobacter sp. M-2]|uniref:hypothetical protein n=1 Tax=Pseudoxanthobacter sp. M-2 TaxID=3078754 RepID=UPI0038FBE787
MLWPKPYPEHWRLLSESKIALRKGMPWSGPMQRQLWHAQPHPFAGRELTVTSDYGGEHNSATHRVYAFLISQRLPPAWFKAMQHIRLTLLTDGRRMSFKRVVDEARMNALIAYLDAADALTGHLVVIAVDKRIKHLVCPPQKFSRFRSAFDLKARWNEQGLEDMARKAYFLTICLSIWAAPGMDLEWISDQDQSVANELRLDDFHRTAARMISLYLQFPMGVFAMNTTAIDGPERHYEDLCAIPDLAAGMVSDVSAAIFGGGGLQSTGAAQVDSFSEKTEMIASWFWWPIHGLKRTMLSFDHGGGGPHSIRTITMKVS